MSRLLVTLFMVSLLLPWGLAAQTRRALVIGLGEQLDGRWAKINGDKDVDYVTDMLARAGYKDINTLVNRQATKRGIMDAFRQLADGCMPGDMVYVHFSGHGQRVTDINGDEDDGWDEAWIPYDAYMEYDGQLYRGENHLVDDEVNWLLTGIRKRVGDKGAIMVVVDACHSGGSARGKDEWETVRGAMNDFVIPGTHRGHAAQAPEPWLTLSACKDYQQNVEMTSPQVGLLTYALYSITGQGHASFEAVQSFMSRHRGRYPQNPVLTGDETTYTISDFLE